MMVWRGSVSISPIEAKCIQLENSATRYFKLCMFICFIGQFCLFSFCFFALDELVPSSSPAV